MPYAVKAKRLVIAISTLLVQQRAELQRNLCVCNCPSVCSVTSFLSLLRSCDTFTVFTRHISLWLLAALLYKTVQNAKAIMGCSRCAGGCEVVAKIDHIYIFRMATIEKTAIAN